MASDCICKGMRVSWKVVSFLGITQGITGHRKKLKEKMRPTVFCFFFSLKCECGIVSGIYHVSLNISSSILFLIVKVLLVCGGTKKPTFAPPSVFF